MAGKKTIFVDSDILVIGVVLVVAVLLMSQGTGAATKR